MWRRERVEVFMADESSRLQTIEWNALDVCMSSTANSIASCARLLRKLRRLGISCQGVVLGGKGTNRSFRSIGQTVDARPISSFLLETMALPLMH